MKTQLIFMLSPVVEQGIYEVVQPTVDLGETEKSRDWIWVVEMAQIEQELKKPKDYPNRV